jgi:hypothetical protein
MILVLDDQFEERVKQFQKWYGESNVVWASNPQDALSQMTSQEFEAIFLDHDLGSRQLDLAVSGMARSMARDRIATNTPIFVHSMNNVGANTLFGILQNSHNVKMLPFGQIAQLLGQQEDEPEPQQDDVQNT